MIRINIIDFFNNVSDTDLISLVEGDFSSIDMMCYALSLELQLIKEGKPLFGAIQEKS